MGGLNRGGCSKLRMQELVSSYRPFSGWDQSEFAEFRNFPLDGFLRLTPANFFHASTRHNLNRHLIFSICILGNYISNSKDINVYWCIYI